MRWIEINYSDTRLLLFECKEIKIRQDGHGRFHAFIQFPRENFHYNYRVRVRCEVRHKWNALKRIKNKHFFSLYRPIPRLIPSSSLKSPLRKLKLKKIKNLLLQIDKMKKKYARAEYDVNVMLKHSFQFLPSSLPSTQRSQRLFAQFDSLIFLFWRERKQSLSPHYVHHHFKCARETHQRMRNRNGDDDDNSITAAMMVMIMLTIKKCDMTLILPSAFNVGTSGIE